MNISITFRHLEASEPVKHYAQEKIAKLQKFLRQPMQAEVVLDIVRIEKLAEVRISSGSEHYVGHEQSEDMYASIDRVVDKIERQIRSNKSASVAKRKAQGAGEFAIAVGAEAAAISDPDE